MNLRDLIRMRKWAKKNNYQIVWDSATTRWGAAKNGDKGFPVAPFFEHMEKLQEYLIERMYEEMADKCLSTKE